MINNNINIVQNRLIPENTLFYVGFSMHPTLKNLDILSISLITIDKIKIGDIIVFKSQNNQRMIVHRCVDRVEDGIITRGDNTAKVDVAIVRDDQIIGKVESLNRKSREMSVSGGFMGLVIHNYHYFFRLIRLKLYSLLRPSFHFWARNRYIRKMLPQISDIRVFMYNEPDGKSSLLYSGNRVIGSWSIQTGSWQIEPRFRAFIDEKLLASLDKPDSEGKLESDQKQSKQ